MLHAHRSNEPAHARADSVVDERAQLPRAPVPCAAAVDVVIVLARTMAPPLNVCKRDFEGERVNEGAG